MIKNIILNDFQHIYHKNKSQHIQRYEFIFILCKLRISIGLI